MVKKLVLVISCVLLLASSAHAESYDISLKAGKNFVSLPLTPTDSNIDAVLGPAANRIKEVWSYDHLDDTQDWKHYQPGLSSHNDLTQMTSQRHFIIDAKYNTTLTVTGDAVADNARLDLKQGWSTVAWPYTYSIPVSQALTALDFGTDYDQVSTIDNSTKQQLDYRNTPLTDDFNSFEPGKSYYVYMLNNKTIQIAVADSLAADFSASPLSGQGPLDVDFLDQSQGLIDAYSWDFGDDSTSIKQNPKHTFHLNPAQADYQAGQLPLDSSVGWQENNQEQGTPLINSIENGVFHFKTDLKYSPIRYSRNIDFKATEQYVIEARFKLGDYRSAISYGAVSLGARDDTYTWRLDFEPNRVSVVFGATVLAYYLLDTQTNFHVYKAVVNNGIIELYVDGILRTTANFSDYPYSYSVGSVWFGCFLHISGSGYTVESYWDYVRAYSTVDQDQPNGKYYTVSLQTIAAGSYSTEIKNDYIHVLVDSPPAASFIASQISGDVPLTVNFTNQTPGDGYGVIWDFGDGRKSSLQNPSHEYVNPGTYTVSLTASGPKGTDIEIKTNYISVILPQPIISAITPDSGVIGEQVVISGDNFGAFQGSSSVKFFNAVDAAIVSWADTVITCSIPQGAQTGPVKVHTSAGTTSGISFNVILSPTIVTASLEDGMVNQAYQQYLNAIDGTTPYTWSIDSGILPDGLSLNSVSGMISGTPTVNATSYFTPKLTDNMQRTDTRPLSIIIDPDHSVLTDLQLLDKTQAESALYFYEQALSNGLIKDGNHKGHSSIAATGFGLAALSVTAQRYQSSQYWTITPVQARAKVNQILDTCLLIQNNQASDSNNYGVAGFFYHMIRSDNKRFETYEVSTVDTALLLAGAIVAGEYFGGEVKTKVEQIYSNIDWSYFLNSGSKQFSHGYKPESGIMAATWDRSSDETMLISLLAIGSEPNNQDFLETMFSWPRVAREYGGYELVNSYFGSLFSYFFAQCFYDFQNMHYDDPSVVDLSQPPVNWWDNAVAAAYANRQFCIDQASTYSSYGPSSWGITPCEYPRPQGGYGGSLGAAPCENNSEVPDHNGVIAPYGAISCMPLMRTSDTELLRDNFAFNALRFYYDNYEAQLWGVYGPKDSFNHNGQFCRYYLGIDVGPQVLMIENYRSGFVWDQFMANSSVAATVAKVFTDVPPPTPDIYVDIDNASDPAQDGSLEHPFDTIQEGIDDAVSGDLILVARGTYDEALALNKSGITLDGNKRGATVKNTSAGPTFYCENITGAETVVKGFQIHGGTLSFQLAGSVDLLTIENNLIRKSLLLNDGADCSIKGNTFYDTALLSAQNNNNFEFVGNITSTAGAGMSGLSVLGGRPIIKDNRFKDTWGGAVALTNCPDAQIIGNEFTNCNGYNGVGGIYVANSTAYVRNNVIGRCHSSSSSAGSGLRSYYSQVYIYNNIFRNCFMSNPSAPGVALYLNNSDFQVKNNIFIDSWVGNSVVYATGTGSQDFSYNDFWNNGDSEKWVGITPGPGNLEVDPLFSGYFDLAPTSQCINAGDPDPAFNDADDNTRNDMGIHGGPNL